MSPLEGLLQAQQVQARYPLADKRRLMLEKQLAGARMAQIQQGWQQNPGRMPGGSGTTGVMPGDYRGWSEMLNEQTEHQNLGNALANKPPSVIQLEQSPYGRRRGRPMPESHEDFMQRYGR